MNRDHEYMGDAVYASYDGWNVWLHLNRHDSEPLIALEPDTMNALIAYFRRVTTTIDLAPER